MMVGKTISGIFQLITIIFFSSIGKDIDIHDVRSNHHFSL